MPGRKVMPRPTHRLLIALQVFWMLGVAALSNAGCTPAQRRLHSADAAGRTGPAAAAKWTVMVYLNGDNNLEPYAISDFLEMAAIGSTDKVHIAVQFDRSGKYDQKAAKWSQTLRFHIDRGSRAIPAEALVDIGEANMGDGATLQQFVEWAREKFPAQHYMLIIWDHGQGWRDTLPAGAPSAGRPRLASAGRAASQDESSNDQLYNSEMATALKAALQGQRIDILGFDACLMAMVETGYAFREVADFMVGSEELEPAEGWPYERWLKVLTKHPELGAEALTGEIISAYRSHYNEPVNLDPDTTLSSVRLRALEQAADAVDALALALRKHLPTESALIRAARTAAKVYAPNAYGDGLDYFHHIDFIKFCEELVARTSRALSAAPKELHLRAEAARTAMRAAVAHNYAGPRRQGGFGSNGLSIYFPASGALHQRDRFADKGYDKDNLKNPVEFVQKNSWPDFLSAYFQMFP